MKLLKNRQEERRSCKTVNIPEWGVVIDDKSIGGLSKPGSITPGITVDLDTSISTVDWLLTGLVLCVDLTTQSQLRTGHTSQTIVVCIQCINTVRYRRPRQKMHPVCKNGLLLTL